ncbi:MAG: RNA polymerase sporulation sigma factor SigH [Clostridiales bacterium]|nr:RNA polymerase sporulation sigma factor SigH [Clostridiales bacterium]
MSSGTSAKYIKTEDYKTMPDELIATWANEGDMFALDFLIRKYKNFVKAKSRSYFLIGGDPEDIIQEGMIGLFKAIRDYDVKKNSNFKAFAELCVKRQIITAIKTATRQKHIPLNSYVSLNKPIYNDDSERTLLDVLKGKRSMNPETLYISREEVTSIKEKIGKILSKFEWEVLTCYLAGESYQEIATDLDKPVKSIDNALQRVKKKIEKYLKIDFEVD